MDVAGLQLDLPSSLRIKHSSIPGAGWGVFAARDLPIHTVLGTYDGEMLSRKEFLERYPDGDNPWAVELEIGGETMYVDASDPFKSNWARFANNPGPKEEPNCELHEVDGKLYLQTQRPMITGEEVLWDYGDEFVWPEDQVRGNSYNRALISEADKRHQREKRQELKQPTVSVELGVDLFGGVEPLADGKDVRMVPQSEGLVPPPGEKALKVDGGDPVKGDIREFLRGQGISLWEGGSPSLEDRVLLVHSGFQPEGWAVGDVVALDDQEEGRCEVLIYGSLHLDRPASQRTFRRGIVSLVDTAVSYGGKPNASHRWYEIWVPLSSVLLCGWDFVTAGSWKKLPPEVCEVVELLEANL